MRQGQARWREGKSKRRVTSKDSLFHHHHHPNFYDFFPRAIAPFTGKIGLVFLSDMKSFLTFFLKPCESERLFLILASHNQQRGSFIPHFLDLTKY